MPSISPKLAGILSQSSELSVRPSASNLQLTVWSLLLLMFGWQRWAKEKLSWMTFEPPSIVIIWDNLSKHISSKDIIMQWKQQLQTAAECFSCFPCWICQKIFWLKLPRKPKRCFFSCHWLGSDKSLEIISCTWGGGFNPVKSSLFCGSLDPSATRMRLCSSCRTWFCPDQRVRGWV